MASDGVVLTQDESGAKFFQRVLREAVSAFPRSLGDAPISQSGKAFKKGYGDLLTRFEAARVNIPQRLVVARALLRKPSLLILDEATAALDEESEARMIERLRAIEPRPAAILVAHRHSTLSHCDSVLSIQHGLGNAAR